jgi:hypothetical protein
MSKEKRKIIDKLSKPSNSSKRHCYKNIEIEERESQEFINIIELDTQEKEIGETQEKEVDETQEKEVDEVNEIQEREIDEGLENKIDDNSALSTLDENDKKGSIV